MRTTETSPGLATPDVGLALRPAIVVDDVHRHYDRGRVRALNGASLRVGDGEFVALTGPSGSGKSTLLHLVAALDIPTAGSIVVEGQDLRTLRSVDRYRREVVGLVFQLHNLLPHLDARQNLEIAMFGTPRTRAQRRERADELLHEMQLAGMEHRRPPELSGGERQRVAIARALVNDPAVLLADEPTGSLDTASVEQVLDLFRRLRQERQLTILMVTHAPEVAMAADRVVLVRDGRTVDDDASVESLMPVVRLGGNRDLAPR